LACTFSYCLALRGASPHPSPCPTLPPLKTSGIKGTARLALLAGAAKPSPAIGQALGPLGVNMMEFCKDFNAKTAAYKASAQMRVKLTAFEDKTFTYVLLAPPTTWYLKRVTGLAKGASNHKATIGDVSLKAIYEIALSKEKHDPMCQGLPLPSLCKTIMASAKSLGLRVVR
jgi:large subunit ribosomal protein L11